MAASLEYSRPAAELANAEGYVSTKLLSIACPMTITDEKFPGNLLLTGSNLIVFTFFE